MFPIHDKFTIIIRIIELVIMAPITIGVTVFIFMDWWNNNHFIDDKGKRYKRVKGGFKY